MKPGDWVRSKTTGEPYLCWDIENREHGYVTIMVRTGDVLRLITIDLKAIAPTSLSLREVAGWQEALGKVGLVLPLEGLALAPGRIKSAEPRAQNG